MKENNGSNTKGKDLQNTPFNSVPFEKIFELKLSGMSDRAVAKELGVSHSTVNKHYHKQLQEQSDYSRKQLENLRFQQYLRFEKIISISMEQLARQDFRATAWATIITRQLAEQSRLYGLNTGDININVDQREGRGVWISQEEGEAARTEMTKKFNNHIELIIKSIMCVLLLGEEYANEPHQDNYLKEIIGDIYGTR